MGHSPRAGFSRTVLCIRPTLLKASFKENYADLLPNYKTCCFAKHSLKGRGSVKTFFPGVSRAVGPAARSPAPSPAACRWGSRRRPCGPQTGEAGFRPSRAFPRCGGASGTRRSGSPELQAFKRKRSDSQSRFPGGISAGCSLHVFAQEVYFQVNTVHPPPPQNKSIQGSLVAK